MYISDVICRCIFFFLLQKFQNFLTYVPIFFFSFCLQRKLRFHWSVYSVQRQYFDKSSIMCCADYACGMVKIGKNVPSATSSFLRKYITDRETDVSWDIFIIWKINSRLWAGLDCKKRFGMIMSNCWGRFFKFSWVKNQFKIFCKHCRVCTEKLHRIKGNKNQKKFGKYFLQGENQFFRAKSLSANTKTLWSVLCFLLLWSTYSKDQRPIKNGQNTLKLHFLKYEVGGSKPSHQNLSIEGQTVFWVY